jgi:hypothetical protein
MLVERKSFFSSSGANRNEGISTCLELRDIIAYRIPPAEKHSTEVENSCDELNLHVKCRLTGRWWQNVIICENLQFRKLWERVPVRSRGPIHVIVVASDFGVEHSRSS